MAAEASKSSSSADSYIGSVISLTSKSEIRYEGVLYSINAEESSIGLRNVRSFGSEGRKKDGSQIPPSDRVYEYILFRGTDIKDLQVKSAPPVQTTSMMDNDPAIIQSHYPPPPATSTSFLAAASVSPTDGNFHTPQMGLPGSNFQGGMPLYHPGASLGSWGPSPPPINGNSLPVPVYWPGMYGLPNALPHLHQQTFLQPHPGLSVPPTLQQHMPYSGLSAPPQAAASNVAGSSSTLPGTSSSSVNMGFNPPPLASAMNGPTSTPSLPAATSSSIALISSSFPSLSLPVVPSLQQSIIYSGFSAPAPAAAINLPSSSSMPFTTNGSSAILGYNPPLPALDTNVPSSGAINVPSSSSMPFTTNSSSATLGYNPSPPALAMNVPSSGSPLLADSSSSTPLTSSSFPSLSLPVTSQTSSNSVFDKDLNSVHSLGARNVVLPMLASLTISDSETISVNPPLSSSKLLPYKSTSQTATSVLSSSTPSQKEVLIPSLVTPGQLLQSKKSETSSQSLQVAHKDVEVTQVSSSIEQSVLVTKENEAQPPILPLPPAPRPYHKPNGAPQVRHNYRGSGRGRGRGRGRGTGGSLPVARFTEDFDFSAMNEKFNKDEVWGHLGKSNKIHSNEKEGDEIDEDGYEDEDGAELPKIEVKPVYNKDDFFDTLSSNARDNGSQDARPRFSEQLKLDTETFGEFAKYRGGRGGHGPSRSGRGSIYGRGNSYGRSGTPGRGYGHAGRGRGRGRALSSQAS